MAPELMVSSESLGVDDAFVAIYTGVWRADVRRFGGARRRIIRVFARLYRGQLTATSRALFLRLPCGIIWFLRLDCFLRRPLFCDINIRISAIKFLFLDPSLLPWVRRTAWRRCMGLMLSFRRHRILKIVYAHARTPLQYNLCRRFIERRYIAALTREPAYAVQEAVDVSFRAAAVHTPDTICDRVTRRRPDTQHREPAWYEACTARLPAHRVRSGVLSKCQVVGGRRGIRLRGAENRAIERAMRVAPIMAAHGIRERLRAVKVAFFATGEVVGRRAGQLVSHLGRDETLECRVDRQRLVFFEHASSAEPRAVVSGASAEAVEWLVFVVLPEKFL